MSRITIIRPLAIGVAIIALAAPAAVAAPIDYFAPQEESTQDLRSADAIDAATPKPEQTQDLRSADAIDAATPKPEQTQDLRSADAIDAATPKDPRDNPGIQTGSLAGTTSSDNPTYWAYDYQAPDPADAAALAQEQAYSTFVKAAPAAPANDDDGTPWAIIGLAISGALLAGLAAATVVVKTRVRRTQRVAV
jgi:hypothetical protein